MRLKISKDIYPKEAIIKASYFFTDKYYLQLDSDDKYYYVDMVSKIDDECDKNADKEFMNEVLTQTTRYNIMMQTKNIRELVVGRALASTIIDDSDTGFIDDEAINSEEILQNWFEKYDK